MGNCIDLIQEHDLWLNSGMCEKEKGTEMEDHTSITLVSQYADFLCCTCRPRTQKAYQCKTKCISLRRKDIENETGKSTKPSGISCEAFQISADMHGINIQLGCLMFCFYIFVCF